MRRIISKVPQMMMAVIMLGSIGACNYGLDTLPERESRVTLYGTAITSDATNTNNVRVGSLIISNFQIGTQAIDMSYASSTEFGVGSNINNVTIRSNADAELIASASQPQTNTLISSGDHRTAVIGEGTTPNGNYTEITLRLYQNKSASSTSFARDKSLYILGTSNGRPVRIWLTNEENIRATSERANGYEITSDSDLLLRFNLEKLLDNINLGSANDGNKDGFIDIGPEDVDGNGELFNILRSNLSSFIEFGH